MYTDRPPNERLRPLLGAGQFIQPSPEPRLGISSSATKDFAPGFSFIPSPSHKGSRQVGSRSDSQKASTPAKAGEASKGKKASASNGTKRSTKKTSLKDTGQCLEKVAIESSSGSMSGEMGGVMGGVMGGNVGGTEEDASPNDATGVAYSIDRDHSI